MRITSFIRIYYRIRHHWNFSIHAQGRKVIPQFHSIASWRKQVKNWETGKKKPSYLSIFGDVSLHFHDSLTSSWQGLVHRLDENFLQCIPGSGESALKIKNSIDASNVLSQHFSAHKLTTHFQSDLDLGSVVARRWNVIPFSFSRSRSVNRGTGSTIVLRQKIPGINTP